MGRQGSFRVYAVVMTVAAGGYWLLVRDAGRKGAKLTLAGLLAPLKNARAWRFGLYYMATFGVFVTSTLTLSDIYIDAYGMSLKTAGVLATASLLPPASPAYPAAGSPTAWRALGAADFTHGGGLRFDPCLCGSSAHSRRDPGIRLGRCDGILNVGRIPVYPRLLSRKRGRGGRRGRSVGCSLDDRSVDS
jgi:hypothetical protein